MQLFTTLKPTSVVILDTQTIGELKSDSELLGRGDYYPLLALRSSSLTTKPRCPFLEPPNTVGGLSAEGELIIHSLSSGPALST